MNLNETDNNIVLTIPLGRTFNKNKMRFSTYKDMPFGAHVTPRYNWSHSYQQQFHLDSLHRGHQENYANQMVTSTMLTHLLDVGTGFKDLHPFWFAGGPLLIDMPVRCYLLRCHLGTLLYTAQTIEVFYSNRLKNLVSPSAT